MWYELNFSYLLSILVIEICVTSRIAKLLKKEIGLNNETFLLKNLRKLFDWPDILEIYSLNIILKSESQLAILLQHFYIRSFFILIWTQQAVKKDESGIFKLLPSLFILHYWWKLNK